MSAPGVGSTVFETVESSVTANVESSSFTETAQIAQYVYQDLERLVLQHNIPIAQDLDFRGYDGDPEDFMRKLFGDIERLLNDGLISSLSFILSDPIGNDSRYQVRYRVTYRIYRDLAPEHVGRQGGYLEPPEALIPGAKFSMVAEWTSESAGNRASKFTTGRYNFIWVPVNLATFDDSRLSSDSRRGDFVPYSGDRHVVRLEQARNTL